MNKVRLLLKIFPQTYSEELGIDLKSKRSEEIFKWFLASILFAHRISGTIAKKTFKEFEKEDLTTSKKILNAGWDELVRVLDNGGYNRYDYSTATALLQIMKQLEVIYGSLENLHKQAKNQKDLEEKLQEFPRVGPVTTNIFLRELRDAWKVDPMPSKFTIIAAKKLKLIRSSSPGKVLIELKKVWGKSKIKGKTFANFETALLRFGKNYYNLSLEELCAIKKKGL